MHCSDTKTMYAGMVWYSVPLACAMAGASTNMSITVIIILNTSFGIDEYQV